MPLARAIFMKIIDRYIIKEIAFPFSMTLFVFTFVLMIGKILQIMELMVNRGVRFFDISLLMLYIMPQFLIITMPISFLISILIGMGRLSTDNEITVLKASGCGLQRLLQPIAIAALTVFLLTAMTGVFAPLSNRAMKVLLFELVQQRASIGIKEKVFNDDFKDLVLYTEKIDPRGDFMEGILISDQRLAREPATIVARKGILVSNTRDMTVTLRLYDGSIHTLESSMKNYRRTGFSTYDVNLDLKTVAAGQGPAVKKGSVDMTFGELLENIKKPGFQEHEKRDMIIELNKKFSIPVSCFVFGLLALPFAIVNRRSGKSKGFTVGIVIVVFYYTLQLAGEALGETGKMSPVLAVWTPNLVLGATGVYLFTKAVKEEPYLPVELVELVREKLNSIAGKTDLMNRLDFIRGKLDALRSRLNIYRGKRQ